MSESVLVVDDDRSVARMLARTLSAEGYRTATAEDGGTALALVERDAPDAVVLDLVMPGMDGLAVARRLRRKGVSTPILMLTARDAIPDRVAGLDAAPTTTWSSRSQSRSWSPVSVRCSGGRRRRSRSPTPA